MKKSDTLLKPIEWSEFKTLSKTEQTAYLQSIITEYGIGFAALSTMFGISINTCAQYLRRNLSEFAIPKRAPKIQNQRFYAEFCPQNTLLNEEKQAFTKKRNIRRAKPIPPLAASTYEDQHEPAIHNELHIELPQEIAQAKVLQQQRLRLSQEPAQPTSTWLKRSVLNFSGPLNTCDIAAKLAVLFADGENVRVQVEVESGV